MKHILLSGLSILLLLAIAPVVEAQAPVSETATTKTTAKDKMAVKPFNLVYMAYQGFFKDDGVPEAELLIDEDESGRLTAKRFGAGCD